MKDRSIQLYHVIVGLTSQTGTMVTARQIIDAWRSQPGGDQPTDSTLINLIGLLCDRGWIYRVKSPSGLFCYGLPHQRPETPH